MGQADIYKILKDNPNKYFSAEDLKSTLGMNVQSIYSAMKKMADRGELKVKEGKKPTKGPRRKVYAFLSINDNFDQIINEYKQHREQGRYGFFNADVIATLMLLNEVRELKEGIKKWK